MRPETPDKNDIPERYEVADEHRCATRILFVDPYYRAIKREFNKPLAAFLRNVSSGGPQVTVESAYC